MILSADRLNILISSKGVNLKKTKVISVEEISEVTLGMQDKSVWGSKNSKKEENCAFTIRFKDTVKIGQSQNYLLPFMTRHTQVNFGISFAESLRPIGLERNELWRIYYSFAYAYP